MFGTGETRIPSFWWFQAAGWSCFCLLSVLVVLPYLRQPSELGYQDSTALLVDQGLLSLSFLLASLALRPVCRSLVQRLSSWIAMEVRAAGWSLAIGTFAAVVASRFILVKPEPIELLEACAKTSVLLFLWCNLYFSLKQSQIHSQARNTPHRDEAAALRQDGSERICRFIVRTGPRILVVPAEDVAWISAAGDYPPAVEEARRLVGQSGRTAVADSSTTSKKDWRNSRTIAPTFRSRKMPSMQKTDSESKCAILN
jgi:hypothetical protein